MTTMRSAADHPPVVEVDSDDEDEIVLFGCKLIISAAGVVGARRRHESILPRRSPFFIRVRCSVQEIYSGMGDSIFDAHIGCTMNHFGVFTRSWMN